MDFMKIHYSSAWDNLDKIDRNTWCKDEFYPDLKSDLVVNNVSESWNAKIKDARDEL